MKKCPYTLYFKVESAAWNSLLIDVDLEVRIDLKELQDQFDLMTQGQLIGVATDQARARLYNIQYANE